MASSCQSVLSTEAMLTVLLGTEAHTWNYVGRDVLGQLGGLLVMSGLTKHTDRQPHQFIKVSHGLQQASMAILMCTPLVDPSWFLPVAAAANVCANISFIGFGSINAKCIQKLSGENNNVGELYAKLSVHQTLASTLGLSMGMLLNEHSCYFPEGAPSFFFAALGVLRVVSYSKAVKNVL